MERIKDEMTALSSQNLTIDRIKVGECLEFDKAAKINRKEEYVQLNIAQKIVELYAKDLQSAYLAIEQLEAEIEDSRKALDEVTEAANKSASQVKQVLAGQQRFGESEKKLAELMASVEQLRQSHADDGALIAQLKQQIADAQQIAATVPELAQDVQDVLDALEISLRNAGIDPNELLDELE